MNINSDLIAWCHSHFGPMKPFRSARSWALDSGLHPHAVNVVIESGKVSARAAIALARSAGASPIEALMISGYLEKEDVPGNVTAEESDLLTTFRRLRPYDQTVLRNIARSLIGTDEGQVPSAQEPVHQPEGLTQ